MKIKEIKRTANVAWSPKEIYPLYIAAGTAAQQLDATFSTTAALEIYHVDFTNQSLEMPVVGCMPSEHRFHKLLWSDYGVNTDDHPNGMILGGTDDGKICVLDAATILSGDQELSLLDTLADHTGPVQALDMNKFQHNLIASGAADSEIFIWDLRNPETPLTPGTKTSPPDQISCLAWNAQVQHILASSSQTGRVVIWDLRKSEPIIKVGDQSAMFHYKSMAWHPNVATQILIGNEDDRYPVIQMWDLRFATSPMKIFEGHTRGVLSLDWCPQDEDLLMSCGKDNRILCWNPNTQLQKGEIIYELPTSAQWTSDVRWCPRNPGIVSTTAFDGHITVSSLMGGSIELHQEQRNQISDSFGIQQDVPLPSQPTTLRVEPLKTPPKWMRTPCGARFSFGGKLISCDNSMLPQQIHVSQVVTESEFLQRSNTLERALINGQLVEFCETKIMEETDPQERLLWQFLKSNFHNEPRMQFLNLLGYNPQEISKKISAMLTQKVAAPPPNSVGINAAELASKIEQLKVDEANDNSVDDDAARLISPLAGETPEFDSDGAVYLDDSLPIEDNHLLSAVPTGAVAAESTPQEANIFSPPDGTAEATGASLFEFVGSREDCFHASEGSNMFDAIADGAVALHEHDQYNYIEQPALHAQEKGVIEKPKPVAFTIPTDNEMDGLICQALLAGNFEVAVDVCFSNQRMADGLLLAIAGGPELFAQTQKRYLDQSHCAVSKIISAIVNRDWRSIVENACISNWKEALSTLVTYSKAEEFSQLCCNLGERLENEAYDYNSAILCYICAGDVERMIACWTKSSDGEKPSPGMLQNLIEKMMILKKSVENEQQPVVGSESHVARQLSNYASLLSSQGNLQTALVYLSVINSEGVAVLKDRVYRAHGGIEDQDIPSPFQNVDIQAVAAKPVTPITPLQEAATPPTYSSGSTPLSYQQHNQQEQYNYTNATSAYYIPSAQVAQPTYNTSVSSSNMYNPSPPQQNLYQPPPPAPVPSTAPVVSNQQYSQPPSNQVQPSIYHPGLNYHSPQPSPSPAPATQVFNPAPPAPQVFNPAANLNHSMAPPPGEGLHSPGMMKPTPPPPSAMNPPPAGSGSIMSMRAAKEESNNAKNIQPAPMNFYNPAAQQNMQPEMNGHRSMAPMPDVSHGTNIIPPQSQPQQLKKEVPVVQEKVVKPIPEEHIQLQVVFDTMVQNCRGATKNPQSKRKLDDVCRKLEFLYNLLRENGISQNVLNGLHQMSQACMQRDYIVGIQIHTQMITTGNFSEISSFMPGLKTLMQISGQLKI